MKNMPFGKFSTGLYRKNRFAAVGRIVVSGGLAAIFAGPEPARLCYPVRFAGKSPGYASLKSGCPSSIHRHGM
jgi:hypothetical protein